MMTSKNHIVYNYNDIHECLTSLKDIKAKDEEVDMSFSTIASRLGMNSRTKIKKIFKGESRLSKKNLAELGEFFELDRAEIKYLDLLRMFKDSTDAEQSLAFYEKIVALRKKNFPNNKRNFLEEIQLKILEHWYVLPIAYYIELKNSSSNIFDIVKAFKGKLTNDEIENAIGILKASNIICYNENGELALVEKNICILDGIPRNLVKNFHLQMIERAKDSVYGLPQDKRYLMGVTLRTRNDFVPEIKEKVKNFVLKLNEEYTVEDADSIFQYSSQFFQIATTL